MEEYQIALSPDMGITPEEFAETWNQATETRDVADAHLSEAKSGQFIDPTLVAGVLLSLPANLVSSTLYDLIKSIIERVQLKKGRQAHKHMHIEEIKMPDGTRILVVDYDEG